MTTAQFIVVTRTSRSGGHPHVIFLDALSHTPIDVEHPCSCAAGSNGRYCWAVLEVIAEQAPGTQAAEIANVIIQSRKAR